MPDVTVLSNHLKKQGFHVVFQHSPPGGDVEIGFCNVRKDPSSSNSNSNGNSNSNSNSSNTGTTGGSTLPQEAVFMARFVAAGTGFNAVMKSDDATNVPGFVKKFALAKVLKIDTGGGK